MQIIIIEQKDAKDKNWHNVELGGKVITNPNLKIQYFLMVKQLSQLHANIDHTIIMSFWRILF